MFSPPYRAITWNRPYGCRLKIGFTLIELMVAVSVLSVGTVAVLHSRLGIVSALDSAANQMKAWRFLESRMNELEQAVIEDGGIQEQEQQEDIMLGSRQAIWSLATVPVVMPEGEEGEEVGANGRSPLRKVTMSLSWKEGNKDKDVVLVTYLPEKPDDL